ncbi:MAG: hypothetical protein HeimC3_40430 [Candidatus Heimdallarchaeota archaeon LC_3]|nr:MAG: hypothetical protein HeimC3_40430 [Candidatus Heimdallarchaeota archaeon LC_3]
MSVIKKFGYQNYTGNYYPRKYRIWQLCWFNLRERIWNQKSVIIPLVILLFLAFIILIPITFIVPTLVNSPFLGSNPIQEELIDIFNDFFTLIIYVILTNPLIFILFGFIGGRIISEDIEYKSLEQYFTRMRRTDYLIGKFLSIFISYFFTLFLISFVFYYFMSSAFAFSIFDEKIFSTFIKVTIFIFIISLTLSLFMLALSGATDKKNYAALMFIIILLILGDIFEVFAILLDNNFFYIFNPQDVMAAILFDIVPLKSDFSGLGGFISGVPSGRLAVNSFFEAMGAVTLLSFSSMLFVYYKIKRIWS